VLAALARHLSLAGVEVRTGTRVTAVRRDGDRLAVEARGGSIAAPVVVVATGGVSYPRTGSTGDGHAFAAALGHAVSDLLPGEVPLRAAEAWVRGLPGVSVRDVALSAGKDRCRGDVVFTHSGLSGPAALDLSRRVAERLRAGHVAASIDLCPDLSAADVEARVRDAAAGRPARGARRTLCAALPGLPERLAAHVASPATAKDLRVTLTGTAGFDEAVVTIGGIDTREVLPATMESRLVPGLHFAGEVLDLDGPRGGYNLQIAWTTGWTAGTHAAGAGRAEGG
jgi:predicted Rossmann fold flavoprotein